MRISGTRTTQSTCPCPARPHSYSAQSTRSIPNSVQHTYHKPYAVPSRSPVPASPVSQPVSRLPKASALKPQASSLECQCKYVHNMTCAPTQAPSPSPSPKTPTNPLPTAHCPLPSPYPRTPTHAPVLSVSGIPNRCPSTPAPPLQLYLLTRSSISPLTQATVTERRTPDPPSSTAGGPWATERPGP